MSGRILKNLIIILLICTLTTINFILLGVNVSIAIVEGLEEQTKTTNISNIEFDAYFKEGETKRYEKNAKIENEEMLYINVKVKENVSINNAKIKISNTNFTINKEKIKENKYIQNIDEKTKEIQIGNISSNNETTIEIPIKFEKAEEINEEYFNKEYSIKIEGTSKNISETQTEFNGEIKTKIEWKTDKVDIQAKQDLIKYFSLGEKGIILEQKVETQVIENKLPKEQETLKIEVPKIKDQKPANIKVLKNGEKIEDKDLNYNKETEELTIENKNITKWGEGKEEYNIIYEYPIKTLETQEIRVKTNIKTKLYTQTEEIEEEEITKQMESIGNIITLESRLTGEIYKGYMYANSPKEITYKETNKINLSYIEETEELKINTNKANYVLEDGTKKEVKDNIYYKNTTINKKAIIDILGENGKISIKDEKDNVIGEINKDTNTDENGNIRIIYKENKRNIKLETTKPIKEGNIIIEHEKSISGETNYQEMEIDKFTKLEQIVEVSSNIVEQVAQAEIELKNTTTEANIEINKTSLSTMKINKNVEIKVVLKSNNPKYDLYKDARIKMIFPEDITNVNVNSINMLYGEMFEIKPTKGIEEGREIINIDLNQNQLEYQDIAIEGTTIIINADLTLNNKATSKEESIIMNYHNVNAKQYKNGQISGSEEQKIQINSPKGLITINNIEDLGIETIGEEGQISKIVEKGKKEKEVNVKTQIINNNQQTISNVTILGEFPTEGQTNINNQKQINNMGITLKSGLNITAPNTENIKTYYSENENATDDINNEQNQWKETQIDSKKTRKYLVTIPNLEQSGSVLIEYSKIIPANLDYNKQAYQGYNVSYIEENSQTTQNVKSTIIEETTGKGPEIQATLSQKVGNQEIISGSEIQAGEVIKYIIEVKNTGTKDATNVKVKGGVPTGTVIVEPMDKYGYSAMKHYNEIEGTEKNITIDELKVGETKKVSYEVRVKNNIVDATNIKNTCEYTYEEVTKTTNEINNILKTGDIRITSERITDLKSQASSLTAVNYRVIVENTSNSIQKDIKLKLNFPEFTQISSVIALTMKLEDNMEIAINSENIKYSEEMELAELQPGEIRAINYTVNIGNVEKDITMDISAIINQKGTIYRSNEVDEMVKGVSIDCTLETDKSGYLESEDEFTYTIKIKNNNTNKISAVTIEDQISSELTLKQVLLNDKEEIFTNSEGQNIPTEQVKKITLSTDLEGKSENIIKIKCRVSKDPSRDIAKTINNKAIITILGNPKETNTITQTIMPEIKIEDNTRILAGIAWRDLNNDGIREDIDEVIQDMKVSLLNTKTNEIQKNKEGEKIETKTNDKGFYVLNNIPEGTYLVIFEYDTYKYNLAQYKANGANSDRNSDVIEKELTIDGKTQKYAVTNRITILKENISDIDIGLITKENFNLKLDKYINKITVDTQKGTNTYTYNNTQMAKVEIHSKLIQNSKVTITYKIEITNTGETEGYIKQIVDYIPGDFKFDAKLNNQWYQNGENIYNNNLENETIKPNEKREVTLILTKDMKEDSTGIVINTAEIAKSHSVNGARDVNSVPNNKQENEDDISKAEVIISIETGTGKVISIIGIIIILAVVGTIIYIKTKKK